MFQSKTFQNRSAPETGCVLVTDVSVLRKDIPESFVKSVSHAAIRFVTSRHLTSRHVTSFLVTFYRKRVIDLGFFLTCCLLLDPGL